MRRSALAMHARRELGCFTYEQATVCGISHDTVVDNVARGLWQELDSHVYRALPAAAATWQQRLIARTLSVDGVAFGRSACALHQLLSAPKSPEVLVERAARNRTRDGLHGTRSLPSSEIALVGVIRSTLPARAVIDAAASMAQPAVERPVDRAVVKRRVSATTLWRRAFELRNSKRPGCARVLLALASQHPELAKTRNDWEARVLRLVAEAGLPSPHPNFEVVLDGQRRFLDVPWPQYKIDLEFDGYEPHTGRMVFDDDRVRQNALVAAGWTILRMTSVMLENPAPVFVAIRAAMSTRGHQTSPAGEVA